MRQVKCKYCGIQDSKENMIVISENPKKYAHKECEENHLKEKALKQLSKDKSKQDKIDRNLAVDLFYKYTGSLEPVLKVNLAFKKAIEKGLTGSDILYTMKYIEKNNCKLNFSMGFLYYIDNAMREKKVEEERNRQNEIAMKNVSNMRIIPIQQKKEEKKSESDISDLFDF